MICVTVVSVTVMGCLSVSRMGCLIIVGVVADVANAAEGQHDIEGSAVYGAWVSGGMRVSCAL